MELDSGLKTDQIMLKVALALLPAIAASVLVFGPWVLVGLSTAVIASLVAEAVFFQSVRTLQDYSALVTGLLIALALPPTTPIYISVLAAVCAIGLGKKSYGGLGKNIFNPAMLGYAIVLVSFPFDIGTWDATTGATSLDKISHRFGATLQEIASDPAFGSFGSTGFEWVNVFAGAGGLFLIYRKIIGWRLPMATLIGLSLPAVLAYDGGSSASFGSPLMHCFSGGTMLAAFFIVTDPVTSPSSVRGQWLFGLIVGALIFVIRAWGSYPDGIAFSVLLANALVPLLDQKHSNKTVSGR